MTSDATLLALVAFETFGTPSAIARALESRGRQGLQEAFEELDDRARRRLTSEAADLVDRGVGALFFTDVEYPSALIRRGRPVAPVLFYLGSPALLHAPGVGMCGSRRVTDLGLKAANACGTQVSHLGLTVISGYAKGVDTATHLAALRNGGSTVIVLAEGINHFRIKGDFTADFDPQRVLVVSQFPPTQPWRAFAAMARNKIISGLGHALIVIEAGEKGGTRAAGEDALSEQKPLLVLDFGEFTPEGNRYLIESGGRPVTSVDHLNRELAAIAERSNSEPRALEKQEALF